ncbi:hypothetical protein [Ramlibacter sp.]|uniref:hypothetical protein n=1 Tax=Ramlibacter sp. TaxID=1917967 RepID=UPI002D733FA5|nr:hypothetical protein [Ramlibacter sp.]HYD76496.1 hypothetical protein [Ramlibacter sp.]
MPTAILLESAALALVFALVHVGARRLAFLSRRPRSIWLSLGGGVSVAYVFLQLLPELHEGQHAVRESVGLRLGSTESEIYLVTLAGLTIFYGLERLAAASRRSVREAGGGDRTAEGAFALHIGSFALYNALIGYLLVHGERGDELLYGFAMALHFVVNDQALREHHKERYERQGRWLLAGAVLLGWLGGVWLDLPELGIRLMIALLAGGVIMNVLKEELPEERQSRFWAFLVGATAYGAILLAV